MMTRRQVIVVVAGLQVAAFFASLAFDDLGAPPWHHLASLALALAILAPFGPLLLKSRTFLGIGVLVTTGLAVASGFFILYWKVWLKAHVLVDWIKWWHVFWSWLALVFFAFHTWINRVALLHLWGRLRAGIAGSVLLYVGLVVLATAMVYPWTPLGKSAIHDDNYILLTWYTWLLVVTPPYALWAGTVVGRSWSALHGLAEALPKLTVRGFVDVALIPGTLLANISGFPITFWKDEVHGAGFKFAGKAFHTLPSIVMAILIFVHVIHLWRPTRAHWRRWRRLGLRVSQPRAR